MRRFTFFALLALSIYSATFSLAQDSSSTSGERPKGVASESATEPEAQPVSDQVMAAEGAISTSDWKTAEAKLNPWLATHPEDARALFDAGYVADAQNRLDDAASLYRRAIAANPKSFEAHLSLGLMLARQGKPAEARPELVAATTLDAGQAGPALKARAWRALAEIDRPEPGQKGDTTTASNDLLEALKLSPETPADTLFAANLAEQAGQDDAAEKAYRSLLAKDPNSEPANAGLGHLLIRKKQYPEAETLLRAALEKAPNDPALTAQLATVLAAQNKAEALPLLQKLHTAHPDDPAVTHMLAEVLAEAGDDAGSDQLYVKMLSSAPNDPDLLVAHGQNLVREGKYSTAFAAFDKATQIDPGNTDGWAGLAFAASKTSQPSVTLHALTMRSKFLPENPSTYFLWATSYDTLHQKAQAAAYYHHFLESAAGKYPNQEWQARQRLELLEKKP
ncbi:MAG TPA: tetratricopeptide repeat protein [Terracidiphilus sp.]|nr:tetratricopeptide repeat protein [Terracidiphilus sp.]